MTRFRRLASKSWIASSRSHSRLVAAFHFCCSNQRRTLIIRKRRFNGELASFMSERQQSSYDSIARSWITLVERRQRNFIELCNTGRWRHCYTDAQFLDEMRKVLHLRNQWAQLAGLPLSGQIGLQQLDEQQLDAQQIDVQQIGLQQNLKRNDRHSQNADAREVKPLSHSAFGQRRRRFWPP